MSLDGVRPGRAQLPAPEGARDRLQALADREALARALAVTENDALTGARTRAAGLTDLDPERLTRRLVTRLESLGHSVTLQTATAQTAVAP